MDEIEKIETYRNQLKELLSEDFEQEIFRNSAVYSKILFQLTVLKKRILELTDSVLELCQNDYNLSAIIITRSIMETSCHLYYISKKIGAKVFEKI